MTKDSLALETEIIQEEEDERPQEADEFDIVDSVDTDRDRLRSGGSTGHACSCHNDVCGSCPDRTRRE